MVNLCVLVNDRHIGGSWVDPAITFLQKSSLGSSQGRIQGEAHPARVPPKIGKKYDFLA